MVAATVRDPVGALPEAAYEAGLVRSRLFGRTVLHVMDPTLVEAVLVGHADALGKTPSVRRALGPALGDGLLTSDGATWRRQRRITAPSFRPDEVAQFRPTMIAAAERCRERMQAARGPVEVGRETMRATLDIIAETMLSGSDAVDAEAIAADAAAYLSQTPWAIAMSLLRAPDWVPYPGRQRGRRAAARFRRSMFALVAARRAGPRRADLVDRLLQAVDAEHGGGLSDVEIVDNLLTFIAAGHETTAVGLAWALDLLARHPAVQDAARREVRGVAGDGAIAPADVGKLGLVRRVFSETMRLYPPAPLISRAVLRPFPLDGAEVEAGARVIVPIVAIHRHRALWKEPERFDPARFDETASAGRHRFAYLPFGGGPRICIGGGFAMEEAVIILATLLQRLSFEPLGDAPPARMAITLRPAAPLTLRVRRCGDSQADASTG